MKNKKIKSISKKLVGAVTQLLIDNNKSMIKVIEKDIKGSIKALSPKKNQKLPGKNPNTVGA